MTTKMHTCLIQDMIIHTSILYVMGDINMINAKLFSMAHSDSGSHLLRIMPSSLDCLKSLLTLSPTDVGLLKSTGNLGDALHH